MTTIEKPKPIIEKITFTKEEQEDIDSMLIGKPAINAIKYWEKNGMNIEQRKRWFTPIQLKDRRRKVVNKYKIGLCHNCQELPDYKVSYGYGDKDQSVSLVEYYCEKHLDKLT